jgi:hypothetical protein
MDQTEVKIFATLEEAQKAALAFLLHGPDGSGQVVKMQDGWAVMVSAKPDAKFLRRDGIVR